MARGDGLRRLIVGAVLALAGCADAPEAMVPVRGVVYYRGAPLTGGTVVFAPDTRRGGSGPLAHGSVGADGHFFLKSGTQLGAAAGWHRISVIAVDAAQGRNLLPPHYSDPEMSGLALEVKEGRENTFELKLE